MNKPKHKAGQTLATNKPESDKPAADDAAVSDAVTSEPEPATASDADGEGLTLSDALEKLAKLEAENKRLKEKALDNSIRPTSHMRDIEPTGDDALMFAVQVKGNPRRFVRANSGGDAKDIYAKFYNILATEHKVEVDAVEEDSVPDDALPIYIDENRQIVAKNKDGKLIIAGG